MGIVVKVGHGVTPLESGLKIQPVITHHFEAKDYQQAFETLQKGRAGKIILHW